MGEFKKNNQAILFRKRIKNLREQLTKSSLDAGLFFKTENIYYITGFYAEDSGSILIVSGKKSYLLVHFLFFELAKKTGFLPDIEPVEYKSSSECDKKLLE